MARTLTDALNAQPTTVVVLNHAGYADSTMRDVRRYDEIYRESTGLRESPAQRLQRITDSLGAAQSVES